jgi:hypothetical protein
MPSPFEDRLGAIAELERLLEQLRAQHIAAVAYAQEHAGELPPANPLKPALLVVWPHGVRLLSWFDRDVHFIAQDRSGGWYMHETEPTWNEGLGEWWSPGEPVFLAKGTRMPKTQSLIDLRRP